MARYLIVTHQTAFAPELHAKVGELVAQDPEAEFGIVVPDVPGQSYTWEGETVNESHQRALDLMEILETKLGARVDHIAVGVPEPLQAISDELKRGDGYDTLLICTLPPGISRWLRMDLVHSAERKFHVPVVHIVGTSAPA